MADVVTTFNVNFDDLVFTRRYDKLIVTHKDGSAITATGEVSVTYENFFGTYESGEVGTDNFDIIKTSDNTEGISIKANATIDVVFRPASSLRTNDSDSQKSYVGLNDYKEKFSLYDYAKGPTANMAKFVHNINLSKLGSDDTIVIKYLDISKDGTAVFKYNCQYGPEKGNTSLAIYGSYSSCPAFTITDYFKEGGSSQDFTVYEMPANNGGELQVVDFSTKALTIDNPKIEAPEIIGIEQVQNFGSIIVDGNNFGTSDVPMNLVGTENDDVLTSGQADDTITGNGGNDTFRYTLNPVGTRYSTRGTDTITDATGGDKILFTSSNVNTDSPILFDNLKFTRSVATDSDGREHDNLVVSVDYPEGWKSGATPTNILLQDFFTKENPLDTIEFEVVDGENITKSILNDATIDVEIEDEEYTATQYKENITIAGNTTVIGATKDDVVYIDENHTDLVYGRLGNDLVIRNKSNGVSIEVVDYYSDAVDNKLENVETSTGTVHLSSDAKITEYYFDVKYEDLVLNRVANAEYTTFAGKYADLQITDGTEVLGTFENFFNGTTFDALWVKEVNDEGVLVWTKKALDDIQSDKFINVALNETNPENIYIADSQYKEIYTGTGFVQGSDNLHQLLFTEDTTYTRTKDGILISGGATSITVTDYDSNKAYVDINGEIENDTSAKTLFVDMTGMTGGDKTGYDGTQDTVASNFDHLDITGTSDYDYVIDGTNDDIIKTGAGDDHIVLSGGGKNTIVFEGDFGVDNEIEAAEADDTLVFKGYKFTDLKFVKVGDSKELEIYAGNNKVWLDQYFLTNSEKQLVKIQTNDSDDVDTLTEHDIKTDAYINVDTNDIDPFDKQLYDLEGFKVVFSNLENATISNLEAGDKIVVDGTPVYTRVGDNLVINDSIIIEGFDFTGNADILVNEVSTANMTVNVALTEGSSYNATGYKEVFTGVGVISGMSADDALALGKNYTYTQKGNDLIVSDGTNALTVANYFNDYLKLNINGSVLNMVDVPTNGANYNGTNGNEVINASDYESSNGVKGITINAKGGNDIITGSDYNDVIKGASGNNMITEDGGNNKITVGNGNNNIDVNGYSSNTIKTGTGANTIELNSIGTNKVTTGKGADTVYVNEGSNTIKAGNGNNVIAINATLNKNEEGVYIGINVGSATASVNKVVTGKNNDTFALGGGNNNINSGAGNDTFFIEDGYNIIKSTGSGTYNIGGGTYNKITSGKKNDIFDIADGKNVINSGAGNDEFILSGGVNNINGGNGKDTFYLTGGTNVVNGGAGNDTFVIKDGENIINGGKGNDIYDLSGFAGSDITITDKDGKNSLIIDGKYDVYFDVTLKKAGSDKKYTIGKEVLFSENLEGFKTGTGDATDRNITIVGKNAKSITSVTVDTATIDTKYSFNVDSLAADVASWLSQSTYKSTAAVFESGNADDINSLLAVYTGNGTYTGSDKCYSKPVDVTPPLVL